MDARFGFDYYINAGRKNNARYSGLVGRHLNQLMEQKAREIAERVQRRDNIRQKFLGEYAKVADKAKLGKFKKLSDDFLFEHARLDSEPSGMPKYITKVRKSLIQEQAKIASRVGLDLKRISKIRRNFADRFSEDVLKDRAVPVGRFLSPRDLRPFPPLLKLPHGPDSNPDVSVYEAPYDGWRYSWWYNMRGVNPNASIIPWVDQSTGFTGSQTNFYMGTDGDNQFDAETSSQVAIYHQMNRKGRIRVIPLIQCINVTHSSRIIDESGLFGFVGVMFGGNANVFNLDITLDSGNLNVGTGVIQDDSADDSVPGQVQMFGFDIPITFNGGEEVLLWMGTGAKIHIWGSDVQIFYSAVQQWQLNGVIIVTQ
jgi:hypothetical protein